MQLTSDSRIAQRFALRFYLTRLQLNSGVRQIQAINFDLIMALIPEPLDKQIARATREREERDNARIFGPVALGAVIGLVLSFVVYAGCNVLNVAFSRRVAASVAAGLIGLIGPVLADQLIAARPNWLDAGFDDRDDASRPSV